MSVQRNNVSTDKIPKMADGPLKKGLVHLCEYNTSTTQSVNHVTMYLNR